MALCAPLPLCAQEIVNAWMTNTTTIAQYYDNNNVLTSTGSLAGIQQVCYTNDSVWIETEGLAEIMGPWLNPGAAIGQGFTWVFPRNPAPAANPVEVPTVFTTGILISGVSIFGNGDATSYDASSGSNSNQGDGLWNVDAWYGEGFTLDALYGAHVQQQGVYHSHATPTALYTDPSTSHSPLVGFCFDGYPVYGPFGYSDPTNASSSVVRMESSFQLRNITTRTTLPDGTTSNPAGPNVNGSFPLGMYIEDYEYVNGLGDLDEHNGRFCVTPEFPQGTYAYFVSTDASGDPWYPYYFGLTFYGTPPTSDLSPVNTITTPGGVSCGPTAVQPQANALGQLNVAPNPAHDRFTVFYSGNESAAAELRDAMGRLVMKMTLHPGSQDLNLSALPAGLYHLSLTGTRTALKVVIQ